MIRRGVSLMEVLFSIGVISVGLLGIISVVPVALHQAGQGNIADRALRMGQNASAIFIAREMANDARWIAFDTNITPHTLRSVAGMRVAYPASRYRSYALDPLLVSNLGFVTVPAGGTPPPVTAQSYRFPYDIRLPGPRMDRVTLQSGVGGLMNTLEAESLFRMNDELVFDIPEDNSPPVPLYSAGSRREFLGAYTWLATLTPELDATLAPRNTYLLSIVVCHKRDSSYALNATNERVVQVSAFHNSGYGGGDVTLRAPTVADLDIHEGNWLLLMGTLPTQQNQTALNPIDVFRWYQVVGADVVPVDISGNGTVFELDVTLLGADWPAMLIVPSGPGQPTPTQAAIVQGVVGVYEKSLRRQDSSLWSQ